MNGNEPHKISLRDMFAVVTEQVFIVLEPHPKIKNVVRLTAWATLPSLE